MLTLLAMLGGGGATSVLLKVLFDAELVVIELAMIVGISGLVRREEHQKRMLSHLAAALLIAGTILVSLGAVIL